MMKFNIERKLLDDELSRISKVVPNRSTMPILGNIMFSLEGNKLTLRSSDIEVTMQSSLQVDGEEDGEVVIPSNYLRSIINEIDEKTVTFKVLDDNSITIDTEAGDYEINGRPTDEFPSLPEIDEPSELSINKEKLARMISKTIVAVGTDELKPAFLGVLFHIKEDELRLVASDVHRLAYISNKQNFSSDMVEEEVIIPTKFLNILTGYLTDDEDISLIIGSNHVKVEFNSRKIYTRLIDENFPDYENYIPEENDKIALFNTESLKSALKRVSIFSDKKTHEVSIIFDDDKAKLETLNREQSTSAEEFVDISYEDEPLKIGFNGKYFREMLENVDTEKSILKLDSKLTANLLLPAEQREGEDLKMIVMPIRMDEEE